MPLFGAQIHLFVNRIRGETNSAKICSERWLESVVQGDERGA